MTAPHTVPTLVHTVVRNSRPVSYAAAFETPTRRSPEGGYTANAVKQLCSHAGRVEAMLGVPPVLSGVVSTVDGVDELGEQAAHLDALISASVAAALGANS